MRLKLANLPTPIEKLPTLSEKYNFNIYIKRDDLTASIASGNKIRKLEFLLYDALEKNSTTVFTCGGIQSNHARATACLSRRFGMRPVLFLRGEKPAKINGNLLIDSLLDSENIFVTREQYASIEKIYDEYEKELVKKGEKIYKIPEGGSNSLGTLGYLNCVLEMSSQINLKNIKAIFCAVGSAGTYAGLFAGLNLIGNKKMRLIGINVTKDKSDFFKEKTVRLMKEIKKYGYLINAEESRIEIYDDFQGPAYSVPSTEDISLINELALKTGLILDGTYTAKAFRGMLEISKNEFAGENVLFIHTGGLFSIFDNPGLFYREKNKL